MGRRKKIVPPKDNTPSLVTQVRQGLGENVAAFQTYGYPYYKDITQLEYEKLSFMDHKGLQEAKVTRFDNLRNIINTYWPKTDWNPWYTKGLQSLCEEDFVSWTGCAGSGKTTTAVDYALAWWLCWPEQSAVILTSTTKSMIRRRAWTRVQERYIQLGNDTIGNMVDSKTTWQSSKGDDKNAIFAIAVLDGQTSKAVAHIQGIHTRRVLLIVDEATDTPEAIFDATSNLFSGNETFQMVVIGNPNSHYDPHGKFSEPLNGWSSVSVETECWETKVQLNGKPGFCLRFDAEKSPNNAEQKVRYPYLITPMQVKGAREKYNGGDHPLYWKFYRGFWAPDGVSKTVFAETLLAKMKAHLGFIFLGKQQVVGACDPAFGGGDRPIIRFARVGLTTENRTGIELEPYEELSLDASSSEPIHYQLANQIIDMCKKHGCSPSNFGLDATGEGGGLADILAKIWSPHIQRVEFGGAASDRSVSATDTRSSKEVYDRRVTELWFQARMFLEAGQLRGIDPETAKELCYRRFDDEKRKIKIQTKKEMKAEFGKSPDLADCVVVLTEVVRNSMGVEIFTGDHVEPDNKGWQDLVSSAEEVLDLEDSFDESLIDLAG